MVDPAANVDVGLLQRQYEKLQAEHERLKTGGGGGTSGGMDAWQTSVETRLGQLHGDLSGLSDKLDTQVDRLNDKIDNRFFWLLGTMGAGFVTLAGMMIAGYLKLADAIAVLPH